MTTRLGPSLRTTQHLALTPQLQQSIHLLQLSALELADEIERMLGDNPLLERADEAAGPPDAAPDRADASLPDATPADASDGGADDNDPWGDSAPATSQAPDTPSERGAHESLADHLHQQALELKLPPEDNAALRFLIESLDDDGYLPDSIAELAATLVDDDDDLQQLQALLRRFGRALNWLQSMDPAGVGARNLAECLTLQLQRRQSATQAGQPADPALSDAIRICALVDGMTLLAARNAVELARRIDTSDVAVRAAIALIARLEPKPGRRFADVRQHIIVPDVIVQVVTTGPVPRLQVRLNQDVMPRLHVNEQYAAALRQGQAAQAHPVLAQSLQEARWFVQSLRQRHDTIARVARAIARHQRGFFLHGELAMRPLTQSALAEELGMHESTISRTTNAKYMATPRGTYELKYFFGSALTTSTGGHTSSTAVKALIKELVASEDPARPWSDARLAELLQSRGIACARRTVAKYREALRIPGARQRKQPT